MNFDEYYNRLFKDTQSLCRDYECPQVFQIFAMLGAVSSLLGKRNFLRIGAEQIKANLGILFCAPPYVKRAAAVNLTRLMLDMAEYHKILPDHLGQSKTVGLVHAMLKPIVDEDEEFLNDDTAIFDTTPAATRDTMGGMLTSGKRGKQVMSLEALSLAMESITADSFNKRKSGLSESFSFDDNADVPCERCICTNDTVSLLNGAHADTFALLATLWDGTTYRMKHRKQLLEVIDPFLTIVASMTPVGLMDTFPEGSVGSNLLSRCIIVYSDKNAKSCPYPREYDQMTLMGIVSKLNSIAKSSREFTLSAEARKQGEQLYSMECLIDDSRFLGYWDLRHIHLHKLAMCLCAYEGRNVISDKDIIDAHRLLTAAEDRMVEGIGEYGNTKIAVGRQKCLDILRSALCMEKEKYRARCSSYLFTKDIDMFISDMIVQGKFIQEVSGDGKLMLVFNSSTSSKKRSVASEQVLAKIANLVDTIEQDVEQDV